MIVDGITSTTPYSFLPTMLTVPSEPAPADLTPAQVKFSGIAPGAYEIVGE